MITTLTLATLHANRHPVHSGARNVQSRNDRGKVKFLSALLVALLMSTSVSAQEVRGVVRDSATGRPVAGAVVSLFDAGGAALGRNLSNELGHYRVAAAQPAQRLRIVRLGYRPRDIRIPADAQDVDILLVAIPPMLEAVRIHASSKCADRRDGAAALALLEQARSGLLSTIVAREANPAMLKMLEFKQEMDGNSDRIEQMTVTIDSSDKATSSFVAERSGAEFVELGFTRQNVNGITYSGPDAEVLLDDGFAAGYCFRISDPDGTRPHEVGLGFNPADSKRGRVDIEGTLWIDTTARALHDIVYRYVGLTGPRGGVEHGGHIWFHEMPNGAVLVDRWTLKIASSRLDQRNRVIRFTSIAGGEVARAVWSDGKHWEGSLGTLRLHLVDTAGKAAARAIVHLDSTEYIGVSDSSGTVMIPDLIPGPYTVVFVDTALAHAPIRIPSTFHFEAHRGRVDEMVLHVPTDNAFLKTACRASKAVTRWLRIDIVNDFDGSPVAGARWDIGPELGTPNERVMGAGLVHDDGSRELCLRPPEHTALRIRATSPGDSTRVAIEALGDADKIVLRLPVKR
ncbi:MAG: hypothetical protein JWM95_2561 [Gemmatimonadetes bacterium]|nr:hypothetical protein [Gemmatimonadota bacterium]